MDRRMLIFGAVLGVLSVAIGAFAAHGLKSLISIQQQATFETGVRYQMYHALVLLFVGGSSLISKKVKAFVFYLILLGIMFFSGSIYALATNDLSNFDFKVIGFVTPIGGLLLIVSWVVLIIGFLKIKKD